MAPLPGSVDVPQLHLAKMSQEFGHLGGSHFWHCYTLWLGTRGWVIWTPLHRCSWSKDTAPPKSNKNEGKKDFVNLSINSSLSVYRLYLVPFTYEINYSDEFKELCLFHVFLFYQNKIVGDQQDIEYKIEQQNIVFVIVVWVKDVWC